MRIAINKPNSTIRKINADITQMKKSAFLKTIAVKDILAKLTLCLANTDYLYGFTTKAPCPIKSAYCFFVFFSFM